MLEETLQLSVPDGEALECAINFYRPRFTVAERSDDGVVLQRANRFGLSNLFLLITVLTQTPADIGLVTGAVGAEKLKEVDRNVREIRITIAK